MNARFAMLKALVGLVGVCGLLPGVSTPAHAQFNTDAELSNKDIGAKQTPLGDLVADAVRTSAKTDVALVAASSFTDTATTAPRPGFGLNDVLKSLAYKGDTIAIVKASGAQLRDALEHSLYLYPNKNAGLLQTSGLTITFNPAAEPGKRIVSVKVGGSALETGKSYRVAMPLPLANGAQAYFKYWKKSDIEKDTGVTLESALTTYLNDRKSIKKGDDRLVASAK